MRFLTIASRNSKEIFRDRGESSAAFIIPLGALVAAGIILRYVEGLQTIEGFINLMDFVGPYAILFGLLTLGFMASALMIRDRKSGFLSRLMTTPARPFDFILAYSLGPAALTIALIAVCFPIAWALGMSIHGNTWLLFLVFFLLTLNGIALSMIIGIFAKTENQVEAVAFGIVVPIVIISNVTLFVGAFGGEGFPSALAGIAYAFPFIRAFDTIMAVNILGLGLEAVRTDLLFLAGFAVVFFAIGVALFRNSLVASRLRSIFSYAMAAALLAGLLGFGFYGGDLRVSRHFSAEAIRAYVGEVPGDQGASFPEDFEDGTAEGWRLGSGWEVTVVDGNYVLRGAGDKWSEARPKVDGWFDYIIETRVRLITGACSIHYRVSDDTPFRSSYRLRMGEGGTILIRETDGDGSHLVERPTFLELGRWHRLEIALAGNNVKVYVDGELRLDYTDDDRPLSFGGFFFSIDRDSHALFDYVGIHVVDATGEAKEYLNEEYGLSIRYPDYYVEVQPTEPDCVFEAYSTARAPIQAPHIGIYVEDVKEGTTFADLRELTETDLGSFGAADIEFVSERETTLADGTTPAHELIMEWSMAEAPRLKTLLLSVLKADKWFSIGLTDSADYWPEMETEIFEIAYSLRFD